MAKPILSWGLGRRKSSVARVRLHAGAGGFVVNGKNLDHYFPRLEDQRSAQGPLGTADVTGRYDVFVNVFGGGPTGQADAVRMGLARAIKTLHPDQDVPMRDAGQLTRDSRMKERKKYGRRGARRGFQFSKR
ncbi:MAG TPA: 30S ribosomal protein S9 [Planctomycetota bacterium]|nr:30S ribosomal protein S9 [Planctomycetota bacterium]